jgi:hypothetical protein
LHVFTVACWRAELLEGQQHSGDGGLELLAGRRAHFARVRFVGQLGLQIGECDGRPQLEPPGGDRRQPSFRLSVN